MPHEKQQLIVQRMAVLRQKYLEQLIDRKKNLRDFLEKSEAGTLSETDRIEIINQAHKMAGTGSTYGFPSISTSAHKLEEALLANPLAPHKMLQDMIREILEACDSAPAINELLQTQQGMIAGTSSEATGEKILGRSDSGLVIDTRPTILAIDDDPNVLDILETILAEQANVIVARSTDEAYRILRDKKPDIIILDDVMPGSVSGIQFLIEKKRDPELAAIPAIMITATNKVEDVKRALLAGASDYIAKPFIPAQLTEKVITRIKKHKMSVLIADDDADVRDILLEHFALNKFMVYLANDGLSCLSIAEKQKPDLIVLDRMMPELDGIAVLKKMRQDPKLHKIPVLILTVKGQIADVKEGLQMGANDYVVKPFNASEVVDRAMRRIMDTKGKRT